MFYILNYDSESNGAMIMNGPKMPLFENISFDTGIHVEEEIPQFDLHTGKSKGKILDYVWTSFTDLVISRRLKNVFDSLGIQNIQYFPIRIVQDGVGKIYSDYYIANIIGRISCLDIKTSKVTNRSIPGKIRSIEELHLDEQAIRDELIFRLDEWIPLIICHGNVREAVASAGITGCSFLPAEGYSTDGG